MTDDEWQRYTKRQRRMTALIIVAAIVSIPLVIAQMIWDELGELYGRIRRH